MDNKIWDSENYSVSQNKWGEIGKLKSVGNKYDWVFGSLEK